MSRHEEIVSGREAPRGPVELGTVTFDPRSGEVRGPAATVRLAPQPSTLLSLLAARSEQVVGREEIKDVLWPDGKVEYEQGIAFAVREIRKTLERAGGDPQLVETIPRRGLRLNARPPARRSRPPRAPTAVGFTALALLAGWAGLRSFGARPPTLALFAHETDGQPISERASATLADELTTALTTDLRGSLGVVGPTGTGTLAGPEDLSGARSAFGACLVLSGSVRALDGDTLVVFTQIVRARDGIHVWAARDTMIVSRTSALLVPQVSAGVRQALARC